MTTLAARPTSAAANADVPLSRGERTLIGVFVVVPLIALAAAVPLLWGHGVSLVDLVLAVAFYAVAGHGVTVGFHRYFTHGSFKTNRVVKVGLAVAGSLAVQGPVLQWVADHRRHHAFSDKTGDPHSPHRYGRGARNMLKGMWHSHVGWLFTQDHSSYARYAPDLLADEDLVRVSALFPALVAVSLILPAVLGGLITWSVAGAISAFFWASLVRVCLLHHVTWSINSVCHMFGTQPFKSRDQSRNFWPLAVLAMGESWHNLHHADPTAARHGVRRGQLDSTAAVIRALEVCRLARDVRWPTPERLATKVA